MTVAVLVVLFLGLCVGAELVGRRVDLAPELLRKLVHMSAAVFTAWKELLPFNGDISAALGRTWQDTANLLVNKEAGMYFLGTFAGQQATSK